MSYKMTTVLAAAITLFTTVSAHGMVTGIVSGGEYFRGYRPYFQSAASEPKVAAWRIPENLGGGFVPPSQFNHPNIICHIGAMNPLGEPIPVVAGEALDLQWTDWLESHHGPIIDYLAKCDGDDCSTVDKETLQFFKINEEGLKIAAEGPRETGVWASDELIANNNTWSAKIPADIAPGNYVLRHEIIALHGSQKDNGAQNYPQCINIVVSGGGSAKPAGVVATKLYTPEDAGISVNIYDGKLKNYIIPGPKLYVSGSSPSAPETPTQEEEEKPASSSAAASAQPTKAPAQTEEAQAPAPTQAPVKNEIPGSGPNPVESVSKDKTTTSQVVITSSAAASPNVPAPTPAPEAPSCDASTVTVKEKGPIVTAAGPTVTVNAGGEKKTVTVTAAAQTVTVTAKPTFKAVPQGANIEDIMRWAGAKLGNGKARRHAKEIIA